MPRYRMKAEWKGRQPESATGNPVSAEVADNYCNARHAIHLAQQARRFGAIEMMKCLRTHHHVHARRRKRKLQCITTDCMRYARCCRTGNVLVGVEADSSKFYAPVKRRTCRSPWNVAESGADVQQSGGCSKRRQMRCKLRNGCARAAEYGVGPPDIPDRPEHQPVIGTGCVEQLLAMAPARDQQASQGARYLALQLRETTAIIKQRSRISRRRSDRFSDDQRVIPDLAG